MSSTSGCIVVVAEDAGLGGCGLGTKLNSIIFLD